MFHSFVGKVEGTGCEARQISLKGADKDSKIYVGKSTTLHNLLFCAHTLCTKNTNTISTDVSFVTYHSLFLKVRAIVN